MEYTSNLLTYAQWLGYFTLFCVAVTIVAWLFKWGIRFRLVGVTSFMTVLSVSTLALGLGLYSRPTIPGAVKFSRVFDTGATQVVVTVASDITPTELEATLRQAAADVYSPGRGSQGTNKMLIRARTVLHPQPGVSKLVYLGQVERSLATREDDAMALQVFSDQFQQLPHQPI